jgi:Peptidase C39 family
VAGLALLLGRQLSADAQQTLARMLPAESVDMAQLQQAAGAVGIEVTGVAAALEALPNGVRAPKIIHLGHPEHFLVLVRASGEWAQVIDGGVVSVVPLADLRRRYTGHALICSVEASDRSPRLELPEFHYEVTLAGVGQTLEHTFAVTNSGRRELTLAAEDCPG